ncbi:putative UDP-glucuronate:xylan alpha-glucuronosyltransferase 3 isoform X1 [Senna tora]|uniref:Hexosyltransferase n=1 Tax=Senna tora TaxID=362788 RepID=A0A834T7P4_9FABA|nr:putative UDP-glucuronate:xylan alpha-glucuronosyltransferase 3 isoform X1 [Senna tora]
MCLRFSDHSRALTRIIADLRSKSMLPDPCLSEETNKRRPQRSKDFKDDEKAWHAPLQDRNINCKPTLKLVMVIVILGTLVTIFYPPSIYDTDHLSKSITGATLVDKWKREFDASDQRYVSYLNIEWNQILKVLVKLIDRKAYQGVGLLNFNDSEVDHWKQLIPEAQHIVLDLHYASSNITWDILYPEWIDEEEELAVPTCPALPKIQVPNTPRLDLIAVKLPCNKTGSWSRDVARLHLQLEAARVAAASKGYHPLHLLLVTDCLPIPNLFTCKELIQREGSAWLYEPNLNTLRDKLQLPVGSCELAVPLIAKEQFYSGRAHREAYATILHSAALYVCGAIAAAQSIRMAGSTRDLVILVDETISEYHRGGLEAAGWKIHTIQRIRNPKAEPEAYNEWNYSKFRLWQLTEYDKIIFIDADMLILRNIDFLFEMPEISAIGNNATLFNSGVMVVEPSNCTFQLLMDHINEIVSYNGGDQGYLNEIFTWWHRIPKHMNFLKHFWEGDDEKQRKMKTHLFGADPPILYVLHYLGYKPWLCFRDYDCNWNADNLQGFASDVAHARWWKVHDAMPEKLQKFCLLRTKQKAALEWDRRQAEKGNYADGHWKIKIQDQRLNTCIERFCYWESMLWHWGETNWTNNATANGPPPVITTKALSSS